MSGRAARAHEAAPSTWLLTRRRARSTTQHNSAVPVISVTMPLTNPAVLVHVAPSLASTTISSSLSLSVAHFTRASPGAAPHPASALFNQLAFAVHP